MEETEADIDRLQVVLDESAAKSGAHLQSAFSQESRPSAQQLAAALTGVFEMHLAVVTPDGAPLVAPIDGIFYRGRVWVGIPPLAESTIGLFKTELHRNPAALAEVGGHWKGLDDLEIATCGWVSWFNDERLHGELDDLTPAEIEDDYYRHQSQPEAA